MSKRRRRGNISPRSNGVKKVMFASPASFIENSPSPTRYGRTPTRTEESPRRLGRSPERKDDSPVKIN